MGKRKTLEAQIVELKSALDQCFQSPHFKGNTKMAPSDKQTALYPDKGALSSD